MKLSPGRLLRSASAEPVRIGEAAAARLARHVPRVVVAATERARRILEAAEQQAAHIREKAQQEAAATRLQAEATGRADGMARVAAWAARLAQREADADRLALDRSIELARLLAERMLRRAVELDPKVVSLLAEQTLAEARGARRVVFAVNPADAPSLETAIAALGADRDAVSVQRDESLARGDLRLETELGVLDARLGPQLERLSRYLKEAIGT